VQVAATTDFVGVYAPRTRVYEIVPADREGWWQPGADPTHGYGRSIRNDVPFAQDAVSTRPVPMVINVWNLRFLQGQTLASAPPLIEASLRWAKTDSGQNKVIGSITNRSSATLRDIIVRVSNGSTLLSGEDILPGATLRVDQPFQYSDLPFSTVPQESGRRDTAIFYGTIDGATRMLLGNEYPLTHVEWYWSIFDLQQHSNRADGLLPRAADVAFIYAECVDPQPAVTITDPTAKQQHWQFVRALVPISTGENQ
jgi:hypothetical protein